jgi:adenine-specific DNA glycosylase
MAWYDATGRELAFRASADPCSVLVSERMAQQTQVCR